MSGRDRCLRGFDNALIANWYGKAERVKLEPCVTPEFMNMLLNLVVGFRIENLEFFNALDILRRLRESTNGNIEALFYAAIRVSVFWRRRKDVLSSNAQEVRLRVRTVNAIMEAEADIMAELGCHVWRSRCNPVERCDFLVRKLLQIELSSEHMRNILDVASDACFLLMCSPMPPRSFEDLACMATILSIWICTKERDSSKIVKLVCQQSTVDIHEVKREVERFTVELIINKP